ncbi:hypothetical protein BCR43DRAFT_439845, partial [Syncephalastrum racemosum]
CPLCNYRTVDRRPLDPPPIVQLIWDNPEDRQAGLHSPYYVLYATLSQLDGSDLTLSNGLRTTAGEVAQSLHKLKDIDNTGKFCKYAGMLCTGT